MSDRREPRNTFERALARRTDSEAARQAERVAALVQQKLSGGAAWRRLRPGQAAVLAVLGLVALVMVLSGGSHGRRGNEPIGAAAVATAEGAGVGSSASGFLPQAQARGAAPSPAPLASPAATPTPSVTPAAMARAAGVAERRRAPRRTPEHDVLFTAADAGPDYAAEIGVPGRTLESGKEAPRPGPVLNIGTRILAVLEGPLRTGAALVPATALLSEDVRLSSEDVVLPAGTRLVGSAFATPHDDRVQIVWRALVAAGRTLALEGETLGADGAPGVTGKVLDRRRKGVLRRVGSAVLGTAGEVAGVAVPYGDSLLERAGTTLAGRAGRELGQLGGGREWLQADTVVELKAGTACVVFLLADLALPNHDATAQ